MAINVQCPTCGTRLKVADESAGKTGKCPECANPVQIPEAIYDAEDVAEEIAGAQSLNRPQIPSPSGGPAGSPPERRRPCPACGESVIATAAKCRFCGEILDDSIRSTSVVQSRRVSPKEIKKFRQSMHTLGGLWIFIGTTGMLTALALANQPGMEDVGPGFLLGIFVVFLVVGVCICMKQLWAVYVGLGLAYLSAIGNLMDGNFNIVTIFLLVAVIGLGHISLSAAKKLKNAGVPLTTKP